MVTQLQISQGPRKYSSEKAVVWKPCPVSPATHEMGQLAWGLPLVYKQFD